MSDANKSIIDKVKKSIRKNSTVTITGHTDRTGDVKLPKVRDTYLNEQIDKIRTIVADGQREGLSMEIIKEKINPLKKQLMAVTWVRPEVAVN